MIFAKQSVILAGQKCNRVDCVYYRVSVCDFCVMSYTCAQNSRRFLAMLGRLRHLGFAGVCTDCNKKISNKEI